MLVLDNPVTPRAYHSLSGKEEPFPAGLLVEGVCHELLAKALDTGDQKAVRYGDAPGGELLLVIKLGKERSEAVSDILVADDVFK